MKRIIYSFLLAGLLSSCYEDKGNYEYTLDSMNEITSVTFSPAIAETAEGKVIEVQQALSEDDTKRRVDVFLEQTLAKDLEELEFNWYRTYTEPNGKSVQDTIHSKGFLEFDLPLNEEMEYDIFLKIYDKTTTLSHYSGFKIKTRPIFKNSLFVLHGNEGERKLGNIEIIGNETKVRADVMAVTPDNIYNNYSDAVGLAYATFNNGGYDDVLNEIVKSEVKRTITIFNKGEGTKAYNPYGLDVKFDVKGIFKPELDNFVFKKMIQAGSSELNSMYRIALSESGEVYVGNQLHTLHKPGYGCEIYGSDLNHQSDYFVTAATITDDRFVFWDTKNNRFLYSSKDAHGFAKFEQYANYDLISETPVLDANVDFRTLNKSPENMTAVLGYINYRENYAAQDAYFVFKDEDSGKFYRYQLTRIRLEGEKTRETRSGGEEKKAAFEIEGKEMEGILPGCDASTITYNSWFITDYLFYSDGKTIYRYDIRNGNNIPMYIAPDGYNITMIKFRIEDSNAFADDLGRIMSIGMYNGVNGAVAEIRFNTAADLDKSFEPLFYDKDDNGNPWGIIKDMQFVYELNYKTIDYNLEQ